MKALIFAAGKGTRLRPFTDHHPKALAPVNGVPLLERNILYLKSFGITDFVINIHHFGDQIREFLKKNDNFGVSVQLSDEKEMLLETGGGLLFARALLEDSTDFLVMNADILTDLDLNSFVDYHLAKNDFATLAVSDRNSSRKLLFNEEMQLKGWRNMSTGEENLAAPAGSLQELAFSGIHCLNARIFNKIRRTGSFSIMKEYLDLMHTENIHGYQHSAVIVDVGRPESVQEAEKIFK